MLIMKIQCKFEAQHLNQSYSSLYLTVACIHLCRWSTYLQLVAASMSSMVKDNSIPKYLALFKELHETTEVDSLMHKVAQHMRGILGHTNNHHIWYRVALTASNNVAATIFDDLTQASDNTIVMKA